MSGLGLNFGKSSNKSSGTNNQTLDPWSQQQYGTIAGKVNSLTGQPTQAFGGQLAPGMTPLQTQAGQMAQANVGAGQPAVAAGVAGASGLLNWAPQQVTAPTMAAASMGPAATAGSASINRSSIGNVGQGLLDPSRIHALQDPYTNDVVTNSLNDIDLTRQRQLSAGSAAANSAGAWGGSRHGVADSLTNEAALRQSADSSAQLRSAGYGQALTAAEGEAQRGQTADAQNQSADLGVANANAGYQQQTGIYNAGATDAAGQYNAGLLQAANGANAGYNLSAQTANQGADLSGAQLRSGAAGLLGQLGGQQDAMGHADINAVAAQGQTAQNTLSAQDQAAYQEFLRQQQDPYVRAQLQLGLLGQTPQLVDTATTGKSSGSTAGAGFSYGG